MQLKNSLIGLPLMEGAGNQRVSGHHYGGTYLKGYFIGLYLGTVLSLWSADLEYPPPESAFKRVVLADNLTRITASSTPWNCHSPETDGCSLLSAEKKSNIGAPKLARCMGWGCSSFHRA